MQTHLEQSLTAQPRMKSPGVIIPEATKAIQALYGAIHQGGVSSAGTKSRSTTTSADFPPSSS